jgi:hypothetical protein
MVGHLITSSSCYSNLFRSAAGPSTECIEYLRVVLGIPVIVTLTHPLVVGPVTNTLFNDFQSFPSDGLTGHVGCPSATVECKLIGVDEEQVKEEVYRGEVSATLSV